MIEGAAETIIRLYQRGHTVFVSSMRLSSDGKSFEEIEKLLPYATKVEVCSAACAVCGLDAFYSARTSSVSDIIHVGGDSVPISLLLAGHTSKTKVCQGLN